ncbi:MAG: DUF3006 domain-containing protein [Clostridia bacterium]|jgi:3-phosphoglycerate kinase|nr:DUF3006 domain-containing protein [Clostridia bacterium]
MKYIVDRIEENIVICENQETKKIEEFEKINFSEEIKDGDVVILENNKFKIDRKETDKRKEEINDLMKKLMKG